MVVREIKTISKSGNTIAGQRGDIALQRRPLFGRLLRELRQWMRCVHLRLRLCELAAGLLPDFALVGLRTRFYRCAGCDIALHASLQGKPSLTGSGPIASRLHIGEGTLIAPQVTFGLDDDIVIGRNVSIGPGCTLYTATHAIGFGSRRMNLTLTSRAIQVEDGVWVGMRCLIMPGVTLGHGCVVSAGSIVTEDVPPDMIVAGNPAVVLQPLPFGER